MAYRLHLLPLLQQSIVSRLENSGLLDQWSYCSLTVAPLQLKDLGVTTLSLS
jgi:hypothetical protein